MLKKEGSLKGRTVYTIGEVSKLARVSISTIRRYHDLGVVAPEVGLGATRLFTLEQIEKIIKYKKANRAVRKQLLQTQTL